MAVRAESGRTAALPVDDTCPPAATDPHAHPLRKVDRHAANS